VPLQFVQYRSLVSTEGGFVPGPFTSNWARLWCTFPPVPSDQIWRVERLVVQAQATDLIPPNTGIEVYAYDSAPSETTTPLDVGFMQLHPIGPGGSATYYAVSDSAPFVLLGSAQLTIWVPIAQAAPSPGGRGPSLWLGPLSARADASCYQGVPGTPQPVAGAVP
jgi:hypothetical protein